ncbi:MAG: DUF5696 domain-containing protein [Lachnospiraceae bacterium]|nr:DUF5696 domain-containing protein [Lachnospiraceae bacterium]
MKKERTVKNAERKAAVIKWLKSMTAPLIITAVIAAAIAVIINFQTSSEPQKPIELRGYEGSTSPIVVENDKLKLTMDPTTTQFTLEVKETGKVWYSNPPEADSDPLALAAYKGRLQSTLLLTFSQSTGLKTTYDNFSYGIENGLYEIEQGEDYIRVDYSVSKSEREYMIPPVITAVNMEKWMDKMEVKDSGFLKRYYKKYDINNLGPKDDKEALLADYPILETEPIYVLSAAAKGATNMKMEGIFEAAGYTVEDFAADKALNNKEKVNANLTFNVSVIYRLEDGDLVVEMPLDDLEYKSSTPIYTMVLLPYFGAGGPEDEGYLLVPEGGGSLINFNNNKLSQASYYASLYGWDMALSRDAVVHDTRAYFNVFGIANGDDSFICMMEEGAPYASVQADIAGHNSSYNFVNTVYSISPRELYEVGDLGSQNVYKFLETLPHETLTQRYRFVNSNSYVDMAKAYQGYLQDKYGQDFDMNDDESVPVSLEIVGAVDKVKQVLGVPVSRPLKLTGYSEAEDMIRQLTEEGMDNISVKYTGWCNGGVNQKIMRKAKLVSDLGSKKDLKNLGTAAQELGVDLYLEGVTHYEYDSNIFDGFFSFTDAARFLSKERAELFIYSAVTYAAREGTDSYYLLRADLIDENMDVLAEAVEKYNANVAFRDTGMDLSSDYNLKKTVSRNAAMVSQAEKLRQIADSGKKIMINMGNDYAVAYADMVTNMDLAGSGYTILDEKVPFYQLAVHGFVNYVGSPLNTCGNEEQELLESAEYGAGLSFSLMRETSFALQKTLYTEYYASDFAAWHDRMMDIYNRYNSEMGHVFNQEMVAHEKLSADLSCTTYKDGTRVYVNYSFTDVVTPDGVEIPARDYKVVR